MSDARTQHASQPGEPGQVPDPGQASDTPGCRFEGVAASVRVEGTGEAVLVEPAAFRHPAAARVELGGARIAGRADDAALVLDRPARIEPLGMNAPGHDYDASYRADAAGASVEVTRGGADGSIASDQLGEVAPGLCRGGWCQIAWTDAPRLLAVEPAGAGPIALTGRFPLHPVGDSVNPDDPDVPAPALARVVVTGSRGVLTCAGEPRTLAGESQLWQAGARHELTLAPIALASESTGASGGAAGWTLRVAVSGERPAVAAPGVPVGDARAGSVDAGADAGVVAGTAERGDANAADATSSLLASSPAVVAALVVALGVVAAAWLVRARRARRRGHDDPATARPAAPSLDRQPDTPERPARPARPAPVRQPDAAAPVTEPPAAHREALQRLLLSLFDARGLRGFVSYGPEGPDIAAHDLPGENATAAAHADAAIDAWVRRGLITPALFARLDEHRPGRTGDIDAVRRLWSG